MPTMYTLRYNGGVATLFLDLQRELVPGEEFQVPEAEAERYTRRPDIEQLDPPLVEDAPAADATPDPAPAG